MLVRPPFVPDAAVRKPSARRYAAAPMPDDASSSLRAAFEGRRLLVVGASSGIGRAVALAACRAGAAVVAAARRADRLAELVGEAVAGGAEAHALTRDVLDAGTARLLPEDAAAVLGGLDTVVYAAGTAPLSPVSATSADTWARVLATNVVGAAMVAAGALSPLQASMSADGPRPALAVLSSQVVPRPWPGLTVYGASKAALEALARGLRREEPWLRVLTVVVGNTLSGFADGWDPALLGPAFERWSAEGDYDGTVVSAEETAAGVLGALADETGPDEVSLTPSRLMG